jgi:hypothetical protein
MERMRWKGDRAVFSSHRAWGLAVALAFSAGFAWLLFQSPSNPEVPQSAKQFVLVLGVLLLGANVVVRVVRLFSKPETPIIDRRGILDLRKSGTLIPWPMISDLSIEQGGESHDYLRLELVPEFEATLQRTTVGRLFKAVRGDDAIYIDDEGPDGTFEDILEAVRRHSGRKPRARGGLVAP